ncbi:MAG: hypothetical protein NTU41_15200 [Chloroflexi bacterium]|nr:hypothetical protein [Chloroflexota bacterium]
MESSVGKSAAKGKTGGEGLQSLDRMFLEKLLEWGRGQFAAMLTEIDESLRHVRDSLLRVVRRRPVWYRTCLGTIRVERTCYRDERCR